MKFDSRTLLSKW